MTRRAEELSADGLLADVAAGGEILERARAIRAIRPSDHPDHFTGGPTLDPSSRELEVLELVGHGLDNDEIAEKLFIGEETVKSHLRHLYLKLGARNRAHAVALAIGRGLIEPPTERDA